ncbi:MAG: hypothetical protein HY721_34375 [Planctomycetes bacterium]|nr:hypothetical protein [Planctomycetota bacterium]
MKSLFPKLKALRDQIVREKCGVTLFALFLRAANGDRWDLVIAGPWVDLGKFETFEYVALRLHESFTLTERLRFPKFVLLEESSPTLKAILEEVETEQETGDDVVEVTDCDFDRVEVRKGYVFTARRRSEAKAVPAAG